MQCMLFLTILCSACLPVAWTGIMATYPGDLLLAAFFPVHTSAGNSPLPESEFCGNIQGEDGIQPMEALFRYLDEINASGLLPGFSLGAVIIDSCDDETNALRQSVEIVRVLMTRDSSILVPYTCADGSSPQPLPQVEDFYNIAGVLGGASSSVSIQLASLLKLFHIPQVSYLSTSPDLSNLERFPYFKRTVPSDSNQAEAIMHLLNKFGWSYVSVVYEDTNYGLKGFAEIEKYASHYNVCFATTLRIIEHKWDDKEYDDIIEALQKKKRSKVVILYANHNRARGVFEAANRKNLTDEFIWVGSDGWSGRNYAVKDLGHVVNKAITVQPLVYALPDFDEYFTSLHPFTNARNPWFHEFWESHFNCYLPTPLSARPHSRNGTRAPDSVIRGPRYMQSNVDTYGYARASCTGAETLQNSDYAQAKYLHYVRDAVYAFAHALVAMHEEFCKGEPGLCDSAKPPKLKGDSLLLFLDQVQFNASIGEMFRFIDFVDGPPRYSYLTYTNTLLKPGEYSWEVIGNYTGTGSEKTITLIDSMRWKIPTYPASVCSEECGPGHAKKLSPGDSCCWICTECGGNSIVVPTTSGDICTPCDRGEIPASNYTKCVPLLTYSMNYGNPYAIGCMVVALVGMVGTVFTTIVFAIYRNSPVVKAAGREVSFYLLGAICVSYVSTFIIMATPSTFICAATRVCAGLGFTMVYAAILTKTNRIYRIFNESTLGAKRPKYTSPRSQLLIVNTLVIIELLIIICWLVFSLPDVSFVYLENSKILVCEGADGATYLIAFFYPFILIILCVLYALKTRKVPYGFKETQLIGFTSYTTCILWLAFFPIYLVNDNPYLRTISVCIVLDVNATVVIACLYAPKLYLCLFRPERNTKQAMMEMSINDKRRDTVDSYIIAGHVAGVSNLPAHFQKLRKTSTSSTLILPQSISQLVLSSLSEGIEKEEQRASGLRSDSGVDVSDFDVDVASDMEDSVDEKEIDVHVRSDTVNGDDTPSSSDGDEEENESYT